MRRSDEGNLGLLDFAEDDSLAGFRLDRLELYNWGTFHNRICVLPVQGRNSLLTGDIGSGKSTIVDALTTLLVPPARINYNKAAGAEHKERDLKSYVLGYYKSERNAEGISARPVALRDRRSYSVILGVFTNRGYGQTLTLAQVFWQKETTGQPSRFYLVADEDLSIREHFSGFGSDMGQLRKQLRGLPRTEPIFDSFPPYAAAFCRRFGLQSDQALILFHQTVSMKSVGNLTDFVREHMLEPFDLEPQIRALITHFDDLSTAHEAVLRAKEQIARLEPIAAGLDKHDEVLASIDQLRYSREGLKYYFAALRMELLTKRKADLVRSRDTLEVKKAGLQELRSTQQSQRDELKQAIAENGGDRLESLKKERASLEEEKTRRLRRFDEYNRLALELDLPGAVSPEAFVENADRAKQKLVETQSLTDDAQNRMTELGVELKTRKNLHEELQQELQSLRTRRSNITTAQISIRNDLCRALNLDEEDLPFAGELLQVDPAQAEWEGAIERVLHNFGLSLLVPAPLYARVSEWVDATNLKGRLVYLRVQESQHPGGLGSPDPGDMEDANLLPNKVRVKPDAPLTAWLEQQLRTRFAYVCCESLEEFRRASLAITRKGQVKGSPSRHEKDDRHRIDDRSRYVLGWSNTEKIHTLENQSRMLEQGMAELGSLISAQMELRNQGEQTKEKLIRIGAFQDFQDIDWKPLASRLDEVSRDMKALQATSDILKTLASQLSDLEASIEQCEGKMDKVKGDLSVNLDRLGSTEKAMEEDRNLIESSPLDRESLVSAIQPYHEQVLGSRTLTVENIERTQQELRESLQSSLDAENKKLKYYSEQIIRNMQDFRRDFPSETRDADAAIEAGPEYRAILQRLIDDDLPQFEERFKSLLNENTIREIANFQAKLNKESQIIKERVDRINQSLGQIEYNPGRSITLETLPSSDQEIRSFRQELRSCTEGSFTGTEDNQYAEAKFSQVTAIIHRFRGREGSADLDRRWTQKVTDVRNWFVFAASERWREDNSEFEHYTDSGGKSGGQKEKLAYTVLAASLAYQFGLEFGETRSRSYRFVVIDEAFGRGSDESTRFALRLFRELNLQLLIVTPLQKIHIIEPYVSSVGFVYNREGRESLLRSLSIEEYKEEKEKRAL